jgi:undecaprenyl-diphosphatase
MLTAVLWGLIQGLTEFLPVSSSAHLILVPNLLGMDEPDLATGAVLHLGTLAALLWYFRRELSGLVLHPTRPDNRRLWKFLIIGTIPAAVIGFTLRSPIETIFGEAWLVALCLVVTGLILLGAQFLPIGRRAVPDATMGDAAMIGMFQAFALLPGISRSGMTTTGGLVQGFDRPEAARLGFLLGIPAIAGAGGLELLDALDRGSFDASLAVGTTVAAISGYFAISTFIKMIGRFGLTPFAIYCIAFGGLAYFLV